MISGIIKILGAFVLIVAAVIGFSSKRPAEKKVISPYYYYFPQANVYFDSVSKLYTYQNSNHEGWRTDSNIPDSLRFLLNKKVILGKSPDPVWKNNEHDRIVYSVSLYATSEDFKEKKVQPSPPPPVIKDSIAKKEEQPRRESGIKRFFKKLFHKKNS